MLAELNLEQKFVEKIYDSDLVSHWWFVTNLDDEERKKEVLENAYTQARIKYNDSVVLRNVNYHGSWNPLSFVIFLDCLGWVEKIHLEADVYLPE